MDIKINHIHSTVLSYTVHIYMLNNNKNKLSTQRILFLAPSKQTNKHARTYTAR